MTINRRRTGAIGLLLAAAVLLPGSSGMWFTKVEHVEVEVTDLSVTDSETGEIQLTWSIETEDDVLPDYRDGYCIRGRLDNGHAWTTSVCRDGKDTTAATVTLGKPTYCRSHGVEYASQGQIAIRYSVRDGWPVFSPWSDVYTKTVTYYCQLSNNSQLRR